MEDLYAEFGRRLRTARRSAGISQEQLAARVEFSRASVANIERGAQRVALHQVLQLAEAVGIDPIMLIPQTQGRAARLVRALRQAGETAEVVAWGERAVGRMSDEEANPGEAHDT